LNRHSRESGNLIISECFLIMRYPVGAGYDVPVVVFCFCLIRRL